jgi:hypothetical protein
MPRAERALFGDVFVFAAAVQAFRSWHGVATGIEGRVFNFSSTGDRMLEDTYQKGYLAGSGGRAAGVAHSGSDPKHVFQGIHTRLRDVHNIRYPGTGHAQYNMIHGVDTVAGRIAPRPEGTDGDWRDAFW